MSDYRDYGYASAAAKHTSAYLLWPLLELLGEPGAGRKILDVGCGNGWVAHALLERGYDVYGTDASESGIEIANEVAPGRFFVQDLTRDELPEPLQQHSFDTIISIEVIEHLYSPADFLRFCRTILAAGADGAGRGELILSTPYHGYLKNVALALSGRMDAHFTALWQGGHIKFWSRRTLSRALEDTGFALEAFRGCGRFPYLWKSMMLQARITD